MTIYSARGFNIKHFPKHISAQVKRMPYDFGLDLYNSYDVYNDEYIDTSTILVVLEYEGADSIFFIITYREVEA
jgi:hypothetical protein